MKYILSFLIFATTMLSARDDVSLLDRLCQEVSRSCVEMTYSYSARISGVSNVGQGTLSAQGLMWVMKGNGVEMYCDSTSLWVIDPSLKEVVIEPYDAGSDVRMLTNPAVLFVRMQELFYVRESRPADGGASVLYILAPKTQSDVDYFNVEIRRCDLSVTNGTIALKDGTLIKIKVSSIKLTPLRPVGYFRPQTVFDSSWIVTDLR